MGFPLRSWEDIVSRKKEFEDTLKPSFFCFILYKSSHHEFREFILKNFNLLHDSSKNIVFFVLDEPEDWLARKDIDYYKSMNGEYYNPGLNDEQVDFVCDYFSIHPNKLPAIIAFSDLNSKTCNIFSLKNIIENHELESIFQTLFRCSAKQYKEFRGFNILVSTSTALRRKFPRISSQISYFEDNENITDVFKHLSDDINEIRCEIREGFNTIILKLEDIQNQIRPFKLSLANKFKELEELPQSDLRDKEIEELHSKADEDIIKYSKQVIDNLGANQFHSLAQFDFLECFEEDSLNMIRSCFVTEKLVTKERIDEFDYSLCSVGFWKAMEIELNIILIDTIRFIKKVIDTIPSEGISIKSGKCEVFAGYKWINNAQKDYKININSKRNNKLSSFMFGDLIRVSEYYKQNEFENIIKIIYEEADTLINVQCFMKDFTNQLSEVVNNFRNKCSHTGIMGREEFKELKNIVFLDNGLYKKIALFKQNINKLIEENDE